MKLLSIIASRHREEAEALVFTVDSSIDPVLDVWFDTNANYSALVDWGDGTSTPIVGSVGLQLLHTFPSSGTFQVKISGSQIPFLQFYSQDNIVSLQSIGGQLQQSTAYRTHGMFDKCTGLTSINIGSQANMLGYTIFQNCDGLTSVVIPNNITLMAQGVFQTCDGLTSVVISSGLDTISRLAFYQCINLTSITIPESVTAIDQSAFRQCSSLVSLNLPSNLAVLGNLAFYQCINLTSITIPNSVTSIGRSAFYDCTALPSIILPNNIGFNTIEQYTFSRCTNLGSITIPASVTSIGQGSFESCSSLTGIIIPDTVESIDADAFNNCTSLTSATIGSGVNSLGGGGTFNHCALLATVDLSIDKSIVDSALGVFSNTASPLTINVPTGTPGWVAGTGLSVGGNLNVTVNLI